MKKIIESANPLLWDLERNNRLLAENYLDPTTYLFFLLSLVFFFIIFFTKTAPFNDDLTKKFSLFIISLSWLLFFFHNYLYVGYIFIWLSIFWLYKIREDLMKYLLISSYQKKKLNLNLNQELERWPENKDLVLRSSTKIYESFWFIVILSQFLEIFSKIHNFFDKRSSITRSISTIMILFLFWYVLILAYELYQFYQTVYLLKSIK